MRMRGALFVLLTLLLIAGTVIAQEMKVRRPPTLSKEQVLRDALAFIYIPLSLKPLLSFELRDSPTVKTRGGHDAVGLWSYANGTHVITLATGTFRDIDGYWNVNQFADTLAHEIGHAAQFQVLPKEGHEEFKKLAPELHTLNMNNVTGADCVRFNINPRGQDCFLYLWGTSRDEFFAESFKVLHCSICSLKVATDWRWPITHEIQAFFRKHIGPLIREPKPEDTVR